jgi:hypothetical protein
MGVYIGHFKYAFFFIYFGQKIVCTGVTFFLILPIAPSAKYASVFGLGKHQNKTETPLICSFKKG